MEVNSARTPKHNELPILAHDAYALVDVETWKAIEFLLTKLEPVHLEDLDPDDQQCTICQQKFCFSENPKLSHCPVKTVCGHIFGKRCIIKWLDPLCWWGLEGEKEQNFPDDALLIDPARAKCPTCRTEFFALYHRPPMEKLAIRLWLWDNVFDYVGVARSEKEELSREHIWKYINYCHSRNEWKQSDFDLKWRSEDALKLISAYASELKTIPLTPIQDRLRERLERVGDRSITQLMFKRGDDSHIPFDFDPTGLLSEEPALLPRRQIRGEEEFPVNEFQDHWKINPVIKTAQLEPSADPAADPFSRPRPDHPGSVFVEGDTDTYKSFEIERLLNKRTIRRDRGRVTQYLVRWKGYEPKWDRWYALKDLENAKELVEEYEAEFGSRTK